MENINEGLSYTSGNFDRDYQKIIELLEDRNVSRSVKSDMADNFCEYYIFFDSTKFDKYF